MANRHVKKTNRERDPKTIKANIKDIKKVTAELVEGRSKMGRPTKYTDEQKKLCLAYWASNISFPEIERVTGVPRSTVHQWTKGLDMDKLDITEVSERVKDSLASMCNMMAQKSFFAAFEPEKIAKASTLQLVTSGGILVDKSRLLSGESTENVLHVYHKMKGHKTNTIDIEHRMNELEAEIHTMDE